MFTGRTPSKKARTETTAVTPGSGLKPLPRTPWDRVLKYDVRGKMQLRWDLWITEYFVRLGLPWSLLDHPAPMMQEIVAYISGGLLPGKNLDVLSYWKNHAKQFPLLAKVKLKFIY